MGQPSAIVHLHASGVSLLLDITDGQLPAVLHWGADLGDLTEEDARTLQRADAPPVVLNTTDEPVRLSILPEHHSGWFGKPGITGHRAGAGWSPRFTVESIEWNGPSVEDAFIEFGPGMVIVVAHDQEARLGLVIEIEMLASGLIRVRAKVTNGEGEDATNGPYDLSGVVLALPIPSQAREILDFAGRWGKERIPQRRQLGVGIHEREGRKGRTGADAATVLSVGEAGFGFRRGKVWGVHVAWSGNHRHYAERLSTGAQVIGGGELLLPGEVRLRSGDSYESPWVYGAYGDGLDAQAHRFHDYLRARPTHPTRPRPITLNVWEAVYFDHDLNRLTELAELAAEVGVERFVLDDGWFRHRRSDNAGLGDWYVDEGVWPEGLSPLTDHVISLGMEFGLWFEPEMVNEDSDLAREHPEWILQTGGRLPVGSRDQQVLDLGNPDAFAYIEERMTAILEEYPIAYIKWDHNRDLVDAGTGPSGAAGVHAQTAAAYRLMSVLKQRFPGLEIEACSSGGARVDLGVIQHTDRVWVSDCIDPLERQQMVRWTSQLLPAELLGAHVGSDASHTTGRVHSLAFRAGTALFGHFGIEWDLTKATASEVDELRDWIELAKEVRNLLRVGDVVRADTADETLQVYGTVAPDQSEGLFFLAYLGRSEAAPYGRFTLPGLDPARRYRVTSRPVWSKNVPGLYWPEWSTESDGILLSGRSLSEVGIQAPNSFPDQVVILQIREEK